MINSNYSYKSPVKAYFSSVFKREDIKGHSSNAQSNHNRSQSTTVESNLLRSTFQVNKTPLKSESSLKESSINDSYTYQNHSPFSYKETKENLPISQFKSSEDYELNRKYEDLSKKYDRMQEFYKMQIHRLTEEVSHYKILYHKLLIQNETEKKLYRTD